MTEITEYCILGERCTGTNYLQKLIETNFNLKEVTHKYGWKHFFGFSDYKDSDNVLFIGLVRDPFQWLGSLNKKKHHLAPHLRKNMRTLLRSEFFSIYDEAGHGPKYGREIMEDRNIFTGKRYKNIVELRNTKNKFLLDVMQNKVKNYILLRYEDLSSKTFEQLENFKNKFNLTQKNPELINIVKHTKKKGTKWSQSRDVYKPLPHNFNFVIQNIDIKLEHRLGYLLFINKNNTIDNLNDKKLNIDYKNINENSINNKDENKENEDENENEDEDDEEEDENNIDELTKEYHSLIN